MNGHGPFFRDILESKVQDFVNGIIRGKDPMILRNLDGTVNLMTIVEL